MPRRRIRLADQGRFPDGATAHPARPVFGAGLAINKAHARASQVRQANDTGRVARRQNQT